MGTKKNPGAFDCYAKATPDELLFTLLERDRHAPVLIWTWALLREEAGEDPAKVEEARYCARQMVRGQLAARKIPFGFPKNYDVAPPTPDENLDYFLENARRALGWSIETPQERLYNKHEPNAVADIGE